MPSSTSSSDRQRPGRRSAERLTAADRAGVAQPVPERDVPLQPWRGILFAAFAIVLVLLSLWEWHWRAFDVRPSYRNSEGLWAMQRRRIDHGEGNRTVLLGASRVLFDINLDTWERAAGERPIQLALEGTSPVPVLEDLADDPQFTGRLLVGVAPDIFFTGFSYRGSVFRYYRKQTPSERFGQWLSMHLVEPWLAFYDPDYALAAVLLRQNWPLRPGMPQRTLTRKLADSGPDRNTQLWSKLETDPNYRALARGIWAEKFGPVNAAERTKLDKSTEEQIKRAAVAVAKLRARGVPVLFVRPPTAGEYLAYDRREFPRARTWDVLLARTGAPGIHFEDYPELQGYNLPEWSHLSATEAQRFTAALVRIIERDYWTPAPR